MCVHITSYMWHPQGGGYSLASLSADDTIMAAYTSQLQRAKISMKQLFGKPYMKKDGTAGKLTVVPPVDVLQEDPETRDRWIDYSAFDAKATWFLYQALKVRLTGCWLCTYWHPKTLLDSVDTVLLRQ